MSNRLSSLFLIDVLAVSGVSVTASADDDRGDGECGVTVCADAWWSTQETEPCGVVCTFDAHGDHYLVSEDFSTDQDAEAKGELDVIGISGIQDTCTFIPEDFQCGTYDHFDKQKDCWDIKAETILTVDGDEVESPQQVESSDGC